MVASRLKRLAPAELDLVITLVEKRTGSILITAVYDI